MARTKNRTGTAPSAAHAATDPAPALAGPAPDSPAAAVHAALAASPGSTVAVIAGAAGTTKPAARDTLLAMEKDGTATRIKGSRPGVPDTWTLAGPAPDDAGPAADLGHQQNSKPAGEPADSPGDDETASEAAQDGTAGPAQQDAGADGGTEAEASAAPGGETGQAEPHDDAAPADGDREDADASDDPPEGNAAPGDSDGEASDAPDPALVTDLIEHLGQIRAAADAAELVLTAGGDLKTALAGLDEIAEHAAQARRSLKAAAGGRKAPAVRPGGLRDKVLAHLDEHPDKEFTPHEIHKVNGHSSGAIANALETLVKLGEAEVATEKPRRFRRAAQPADGADSAQDDGAELEGAA